MNRKFYIQFFCVICVMIFIVAQNLFADEIVNDNNIVVHDDDVVVVRDDVVYNDDIVTRDDVVNDDVVIMDDDVAVRDNIIDDENFILHDDSSIAAQENIITNENDIVNEDSIAQEEKRNINYTGAAISLAIPGGGQFYQRRYVAGSFFLAATIGASAYSVYWFQSADDYGRDVTFWRDSLTTISRIQDSLKTVNDNGDNGDNNNLANYYDGLAAYSGLRLAQAKFEQRDARYTAYSALSWAVGLHFYNFLDALEFGGARSRGGEKNPTAAGFLSAVPLLSLGQFYNGRPGKAGLLMATQTSLAIMAYGHHRQMETASREFNRLRDPESDVHDYRNANDVGMSYWRSQYDRNFSRRNTYLWVGLAAYLYTIFDAIVDAQLNDFERRISTGTDLSVDVEILPGGGAMRLNKPF